MTTEQREHKLNKRLAIFEQLLNQQIGSLYAKFGNDITKKWFGFIAAQQAYTQAKIISSQLIPDFTKGGIYPNDIAIVNEQGTEMIVSGQGIYREVPKYVK